MPGKKKSASRKKRANRQSISDTVQSSGIMQDSGAANTSPEGHVAAKSIDKNNGDVSGAVKAEGSASTEQAGNSAQQSANKRRTGDGKTPDAFSSTPSLPVKSSHADGAEKANDSPFQDTWVSVFDNCLKLVPGMTMQYGDSCNRELVNARGNVFVILRDAQAHPQQSDAETEFSKAQSEMARALKHALWSIYQAENISLELLEAKKIQVIGVLTQGPRVEMYALAQMGNWSVLKKQFSSVMSFELSGFPAVVEILKNALAAKMMVEEVSKDVESIRNTRAEGLDESFRLDPMPTE